MYSLEWGEEGEAWNWKHRLLAWEEERVREGSEILSNIVLQPNISKRWFWHLHPSNTYNVTSAYNYLLSSANITAADHTNAIWKKEVPLNVSLFVWRLLHILLPTTNNLIRRHVLHPNAQLCTCGWVTMEDIDHLFLSCDFIGKVWLGISNCLGFSRAHHEHAAYHFLQFENLDRFRKSIRVTFQLIWLSCVGDSVWKKCSIFLSKRKIVTTTSR